ncbi:MAG: hypothetical protein Q9182_002948 [Xanthomendoza sp. 2 TL-2023]
MMAQHHLHPEALETMDDALSASMEERVTEEVEGDPDNAASSALMYTPGRDGTSMHLPVPSSQPYQFENVHESTVNATLPNQVSEQEQTPLENLDEALQLLRGEDDTLRFVGLARLKAILDDRGEILGDSDVIAECWAAVPTGFLDRLLRAGDREGSQVVDRDWVISLAVSIIYTFANLLPESSRDNVRFSGRIDKLLAILGLRMYCLLETKTRILQILATLAFTAHGSAALLESRYWPMLSQLAFQSSLALRIIDLAFRFAVEETGNILGLQPNIHTTLSEWIRVFNYHGNVDTIAFFECVHGLLEYVLGDQDSDVPKWLAPLTQLILESSTTRYDNPVKSRHVIVSLSVALMRCYPKQSPDLLFGSSLLRETTVLNNDTKTVKPTTWMFVQLRLVDIRSSIPSLIEALNFPGYGGTSIHLTACYDLISAFIRFLVDCSDAMSGRGDGSDKLPFSPELVLQIREDISNICSLTVEYLCDRFQMSQVCGAIHPARPEIRTNQDRLNLVARIPQPPIMAEDPLVRSQLAMLSFWLREDEGERLREEAGSMMNVIFGMYGKAPDLRYPLIMILEQFQYTTGGLHQIRHTSGWQILLDDLEFIVRSRAPDRETVKCGEQIVDMMGPVALLAIKEGKSVEEWQPFAWIATKLVAKGSADLVELKATVVSLAVELLSLSPPTMSAESVELCKKFFKVPARLLAARDKMDVITREDLEAAATFFRLKSLNSGK